MTDSDSKAGDDGQAQVNPLDALNQFFVTQDQVNEMRETELLWPLKEDGPRIIARGHLIVWVAPPGGFKTMMAKQAAADSSSKDMTVLFFEEDAAAGDLPDLHQHAQEHGYKLLNSTLAGSSPEGQLKVLQDIVRGGASLYNFFFIFDTMKKFQDLMQKGGARRFFQLMRGLTQRGATVLLLAHTNKYPDRDGKWVFEGVGDVRSDVDELVYIYSTPKDAQGKVTLTMTPDKVRCDVREATFEVDTLTMTVCAVDVPINAWAQNEAARQEEANKPVIDAISLLLTGGGMPYTTLIDTAKKTLGSAFSRPTVKKVLDRHLSTDPKHPTAKWIETKLGVNNARLITLKAEAAEGAAALPMLVKGSVPPTNQ